MVVKKIKSAYKNILLICEILFQLIINLFLYNINIIFINLKKINFYKILTYILITFFCFKNGFFCLSDNIVYCKPDLDGNSKKIIIQVVLDTHYYNNKIVRTYSDVKPEIVKILMDEFTTSNLKINEFEINKFFHKKYDINKYCYSIQSPFYHPHFIVQSFFIENKIYYTNLPMSTHNYNNFYEFSDTNILSKDFRQFISQELGIYDGDILKKIDWMGDKSINFLHKNETKFVNYSELIKDSYKIIKKII